MFYCYCSSLLTTVGPGTAAPTLVGRCMGCPSIMPRRYLCCVDLDTDLAAAPSSLVYVAGISYRLDVVNIAFIYMSDMGSSDEHHVFPHKDGTPFWLDAKYNQRLCCLLRYLMGAVRRLQGLHLRFEQVMVSRSRFPMSGWAPSSRPWTADVVSDVILVALPTQILWQTRLHRNERILMLSIFTMSLLSVMASIVHVTFLIPVPGHTAAITAEIEGALDLMICNLLVLVTGLYRFIQNGEDIEDTDRSSRVTAESPESLRTVMDTLTTIDLGTMSIFTTRSASITRSEATSVYSQTSRSCFDAVGHDCSAST
ncbi:hypothetical protein J3R82DRAFT_7506 [Butyriboletus roseoflavus]|nr:hypothetical protein J3R82DRAFT_7506 [Butyriboletus roseoflavus]